MLTTASPPTTPDQSACCSKVTVDKRGPAYDGVYLLDRWQVEDDTLDSHCMVIACLIRSMLCHDNCFQDGCIYRRDTEQDQEFCFTAVDLEKGADVTCEAEYGTSSMDMSKAGLESERKELLEEISRKEIEKAVAVETKDSANEAYKAIEDAKQKIESLQEIEQEKGRIVVENCSEFGGKIKEIEINVLKAKYKEAIFLSKNIR